MTNWNILAELNQQLENDIQQLSDLISQMNMPSESLAYKELLIELCNQLMSLINTNHIYIMSRQAETLNDVMTYVRIVDHYLKLANKYLITPIARASNSDRLSLNIIQWLHNIHVQTRKFPAAFIDGGPSIRPFIEFPPTPIYYFPFSMQQSLLYLPLLFHEFGHLIYAVHEQEMKELIQECQRKIHRKLAPLSQRNDGYAQKQSKYRQSIVYTWYTWLHELFCDAVGFSIGGPSYIYAFSGYLSSVDKSNFSCTPEELQGREHPLTWLRVQLLTDRMTMQGYKELANQIKQKWEALATLLNIHEDYYGYYDPSLNNDIRLTIDDMLTEASPRLHTQEEANALMWSPMIHTPIHLLNCAWKMFLDDPQSYPKWEKAQIDQLLKFPQRNDK